MTIKIASSDPSVKFTEKKNQSDSQTDLDGLVSEDGYLLVLETKGTSARDMRRDVRTPRTKQEVMDRRHSGRTVRVMHGNTIVPLGPVDPTPQAPQAPVEPVTAQQSLAGLIATAPDDLPGAAAHYARGGLHIFPLRPGGKTPAVAGGFKAATADLKTVRQWWTDHPQANIGVLPASSGHVVIDVDVKRDAPGPASLQELETLHGALPTTAQINTPSNGWHLWFEIPVGATGHPNTKPGAGLDVRGVDGYVILPPSRTDAGAYHLVSPHSTATAVLPSTWDARLRTSASKTIKTTKGSGKRGTVRSTAEDKDAATEKLRQWGFALDNKTDVDRAADFLTNVAEPAKQNESGSAQTYNVACAVRDLGISQETCFTLMAQHYNPRCEPPWDTTPGASGEDALAARVHSAYRNAENLYPGTQSAVIGTAIAKLAGAETVQAPQGRPVEEVAADVARAIDHGMTLEGTDGPQVTVVPAGAGTGKTHIMATATARRIITHPMERIEYSAPDHEQAAAFLEMVWQALCDLGADPADYRLQHRKGRRKENCEDELVSKAGWTRTDAHEKYQLHTKLSEAGSTPALNCASCPLNPKRIQEAPEGTMLTPCSYYSPENQGQDWNLSVSTHADLLRSSEARFQPTTLIVDEDPTAALALRYEVTSSELRTVANAFMATVMYAACTNKDDPEGVIRDKATMMKSRLGEITQALTQTADNIDAAVRGGHQPDLSPLVADGMADALQGLRGYAEGINTVSAHTPVVERPAKLQWLKLPEIKRAIALFDVAMADHETFGCPASPILDLGRTNAKGERTTGARDCRLSWERIRAITHVGRLKGAERAFLLDADATIRRAEIMFPDVTVQFPTASMAVERVGTVVQVTGFNYQKSYWTTKASAAGSHPFRNRLAYWARHTDGIITHRSIRETFSMDEDLPRKVGPADIEGHPVKMAHFGHLRGTNDLEQATRMVQLGAFRVPQNKIETAYRASAAALGWSFADLDTAAPVPTQKLVKTTHDGEMLVEHYAYQCPLKQEVAEALQSFEDRQGIDRARLVRRSDATVIVGGSHYIPGVRVDRHLTAGVIDAEIAADAAAEAAGINVVPLSEVALRHFGTEMPHRSVWWLRTLAPGAVLLNWTVARPTGWVTGTVLAPTGSTQQEIDDMTNELKPRGRPPKTYGMNDAWAAICDADATHGVVPLGSPELCGVYGFNTTRRGLLWVGNSRIVETAQNNGFRRVWYKPDPGRERYRPAMARQDVSLAEAHARLETVTGRKLVVKET